MVEVVGMPMTITECRRARYGHPRQVIDGSNMVPEHHSGAGPDWLHAPIYTMNARLVQCSELCVQDELMKVDAKIGATQIFQVIDQFLGVKLTPSFELLGAQLTFIRHMVCSCGLPG